jgi:hypothetical protein
MEIDYMALKAAFKAAAATYKHGIPLLDMGTKELVIKPVISTTKPMIKFIWRW